MDARVAFIDFNLAPLQLNEAALNLTGMSDDGSSYKLFVWDASNSHCYKVSIGEKVEGLLVGATQGACNSAGLDPNSLDVLGAFLGSTDSDGTQESMRWPPMARVMAADGTCDGQVWRGLVDGHIRRADGSVMAL